MRTSDFIEEAPTDPYIRMVQDELDTAESVSMFTAQAQILGYELAKEVDVESHENDLILVELDIEEILSEFQ